MSNMTAAEAMVKILEDEGWRLFSVFLAPILPFYSALKKSKIKHYLPAMRKALHTPPMAMPGQQVAADSGELTIRAVCAAARISLKTG